MKAYKEVAKELGYRDLSFKEYPEFNKYEVWFKANNKHNNFISHAYLEDDCLQIVPMQLNNRISSINFINLMDFWLYFSQLHQVTRIILTNTKGTKEEHDIPWESHPYEIAVHIAVIMGFEKLDKNQGEQDVANIRSLFTAYKAIVDACEAIHLEDVSFDYLLNDTTETDAFITVDFKWLGVENKFTFSLEDESYCMYHQEKRYTFEFTNLQKVIETILEDVQEGAKLKNLIQPPVVNLTKLIKSTLHSYKEEFAVETSVQIMDCFLNMKYTYQQVEKEAARINELSRYNILSFGFREDEVTFRFFDQYYVVLTKDEPHLPIPVKIVESEKEVILHYQQILDRNMRKVFAFKSIEVS
jgi:hypothetical protein